MGPLLLLLSMNVAFARTLPPEDQPTAGAAPTVLSAPSTPSQVTASLVLKVAKRDETMDALVASAEGMDGYLAQLGRMNVVLKVPTARVGELIDAAGRLGLVVDRNWSSNDLSERLTDARARLGARQAVLEGYYAVLGSAGPDAVVTVERQIVSLVAEVEKLSGQIRLLESQAAWATVTVSLQFRERAQPSRDARSSFAWINTVNLVDLVGSFRSGSLRSAKRLPIAVATPEGFAPYDDLKRATAAVSADEVLFLARAEKHEPEADLAFWEEALQRRMAEAGYRVQAEREVTVDGHAGYRLELAAPFGTDDYLYWVTLVPVGDRLVLLEAAGEAAAFDRRRAAIQAATGGEGKALPSREGAAKE